VRLDLEPFTAPSGNDFLRIHQVFIRPFYPARVPGVGDAIYARRSN